MKLPSLVLINPNIVTQKNDIASSGIPYWPITLAYAAADLRQKGFRVSVIDMFGEKPKSIRTWENFYVQGLTPDEVLAKLRKIKFSTIITYAGMVHNHEAHIDLIRNLRRAYPETPIITLENTQQVTSYVLSEVADQFFAAGTTTIYMGEPENNLDKVILKMIPGIYKSNIIIFF